MTALPTALTHAAAGPRPALWALAAGTGLRRQAETEWFGSPFHLLGLRGPRAEAAAVRPHDARPVRPDVGAALLKGVFAFGGETLDVGPGGDPWDQPSPSRAFAETLHRFAWIADLLATGEAGAREGLRLLLDWRRLFGRWNSFAWGALVLERRVLHLACALEPLTAAASEAETAVLANDLARQARQLLKLRDPEHRAAERAAAAATAGAALAGEAGERLIDQGLDRLRGALDAAVLADGGHATRSPEAGMELLFDLRALDDGLARRGRPAPPALSRAIDRLDAALPLFTLPDGRLACFQGGEECAAERVAAAPRPDVQGAERRRPTQAPHAGYQRLQGRAMTILLDAGAPARDAWSVAACGQPGAIEILCGADRLITNCGWSPRAAGRDAFRLAGAGSTLSIGEGAAGTPAGGFIGRALGPRLIGGAREVKAARQEGDDGVLVELTHDGWLASWGFVHVRRLFLDPRTDELRGEDRLSPAAGPDASPPRPPARRTAPVAVRFHLHPDVRASLARDKRSVLLQGPSNQGWWLRNDAADVAVEPSVHFLDGVARRTSQIVLHAQAPTDTGGRVRWKLTAAEPGA